MLVLKAIGKTLGGIIGGTLLMVVLVILFFVGVAIIGFVLNWVWILLCTIAPGLQGAGQFLSNNIHYIMGGIAVIGIVALFVIEVRGEYLKLKEQEDRKSEILG